MFKKILLATAISTVLATSAMAAPKATAPSLAVINLPYIMSELPQVKVIETAMQKDFAPRQKELEALNKEGQKLAQDLQSGKLKDKAATDAQRRLAQIQSDLNLKARALQEDLRKRQAEEELKINKLIQKAIDDIAKERDIDLVMRGDTVVHIKPEFNISDEVIKRVSKAK